MNRKGQTSLIFIILIPVIMIISALIIDTGVAMYYEKKQQNVAKDVIKDLLENDVEEEKYLSHAKTIFERNKMDTDNLTIYTKDGKILLYNSDIHYSFLGTLFKSINHQSTVEVEGYKDANGKIIVNIIKDDTK